MASEDELLVRAAIRDELTGPLAGIREELRRTGNQAEQTGRQANIGARGFDTMARGASGLAKTAGTVLVGALKYGGAAMLGMAGAAAYLGVKTAASMQTARIGFTTMLGSAKKADTFLRQLQKFAAATPFEFPQLQTAASSLISVGIKAKNVIPIMTTLGNVTSGMGTGAEGIQRATVALQQMTAAQAIHAEDLNQLRDAGIPVYDLLSSALGKSKKQVVALAQAGKLGKPALDKMMAALISGKGLERFNGLMAKQSASLSGVWSTLSDTVKMGLANAFQPMIPILTHLVNWFSTWATGVMPKVQKGLSATIALARQMHLAFQYNGLDGVADVIQQRFGVDAPGALKLLRTVIGEISTIVTGSLIPAFRDSGLSLHSFLTPVGLALKLLALMAHHTTATKIALEAVVVALTVAKVAHIAHTAQLKIAAAWETIMAVKTRIANAASLASAVVYRIVNAAIWQTIAAKALELVAWVRSTAATVASTVATVASTAASVVARGAVLAWTAAQWLLNAAMSANPITLIVIGIAALVAGFVIAYKHSKTFRNIINDIWGAIKSWFGWNSTIIGQITGALTTAVHGITAAFKGIGSGLKWAWDHTIGPIFSAIKTGLGAIKGAYNYLFGGGGQSAASKSVSDAANAAGKLPANSKNLGNVSVGGISNIKPAGDTFASQARGGNFANTLGVHAAIAGASGARPVITNAFVGGGGRGSGSGDHQAGRALDLVGSGLGRYASAMRDAGGYAAWHGTGASRHLHAVPPTGDTTTSKARARSAVGYSGSDGTTGSLVVHSGGITVHVTNPADDLDIEDAIVAAIRRYDLERRERA